MQSFIRGCTTQRRMTPNVPQEEWCGTLKRGWGHLMSPSCLEPQDCHLPVNFPLFFSIYSCCSFFLSFLFVVVVVLLSLMAHSPDFFQESSPVFFVEIWTLFCVALFRWLGDDSWWYVHLAAIWRWYLPFKWCSFTLFLSKILDSGIDRWNGWCYQLAPALFAVFF